MEKNANKIITKSELLELRKQEEIDENLRFANLDNKTIENINEDILAASKKGLTKVSLDFIIKFESSLDILIETMRKAEYLVTWFRHEIHTDLYTIEIDWSEKK